MPWADRPTPGPNDSFPEAERPPHGEGVAGNPEGGSEALRLPDGPSLAHLYTLPPGSYEALPVPPLHGTEGGYLPPPLHTPPEVMTAGDIRGLWADALDRVERSRVLGRGRLVAEPPHKMLNQPAHVFALSLLLPGEGALYGAFSVASYPLTRKHWRREVEQQVAYQLVKKVEAMLRRRDEIRFTLAEEVLKGSGATWEEVALAYDHDDARPYPRFTGGEREREREHRVIPASILRSEGQRTVLWPKLYGYNPEGARSTSITDPDWGNDR